MEYMSHISSPDFIFLEAMNNVMTPPLLVSPDLELVAEWLGWIGLLILMVLGSQL